MAFKTNTEFAQMYHDALVEIVEFGNKSFSMAGKTFTKHDVPFLEERFRYWRDLAAAETNKMQGPSLVDMRAL